MGIFVPIIVQARNQDCWSMMLKSSNGLANYHKFFDGPMNWNVFLYTTTPINAGLQIYQLYKTVDVCWNQYATEPLTNWNQNFMRFEESKPRLQATTLSTFSWSWSYLIDIYGVTMNVFGLISGLKSEFYWFELGKLFTATVTTTIVLIFKLFPKFGSIFFNSVDPWARYDGL